MKVNIPQLLIDELIKRGKLTQKDADRIEREVFKAGGDFGSELIKQGIIGDDELLKIKSEIYNIPAIDLSGFQVDNSVFEGISEHIVNLYKIVPFAKDKGILKVGILDPENIDALEALKFAASEQDLKFERYLISYADFKALSKGFKSLTSEIGKALESITGEGAKKSAEGAMKELSEGKGKIEDITAEAPITKIVASIVKHAVDGNASDIHIEPYKESIRLRLRIDGVLQTVLTLPLNLLSALVTRIKILSELKIDETRLAQDGRFSTKFENRIIDFRVSTFPVRGGEKVVMRILDPLAGDISLQDLGLVGRSLRLVLESIAKPFGALLVTGPTGSGKSTTLASILRKMNSDEVNIVTLEDPIEYYVHGVNQSQIHEEIGYTFANGLRHILRQDPDVIMVGEIRDGETAQLATQAALTGHIVLSTLHTNDTVGVIPRLIDMEVEKYLLAPTLNLAIAQRLVRRLCPDCKKKVKPSPSQTKMIKEVLDNMPEESKKDVPKELVLFEPGLGSDCKTCNNKAYKGRIAVFEALEMTDELEKIILTDISEEKLREEARRQGMITMFEDGILKVLAGITSLEELMQVAQPQYQNEGEDDVQTGPKQMKPSSPLKEAQVKVKGARP